MRFQVPRPELVLFGLPTMDLPVYLDCEFQCWAVEVKDERTNWVLTAEPEALKLPPPPRVLQRLLGGSEPSPKSACRPFDTRSRSPDALCRLVHLETLPKYAPGPPILGENGEHHATTWPTWFSGWVASW